MEQDAHMIVLAMDMVSNKLGKNALFFPLLLIFFINCQKNNKESQVSKQPIIKNDTVNVTVDVTFAHTGTYALNSLVNQRNFSFHIFGRKKNETKSKTVTFTKPTVLESYGLVNGKTLVQKYFAFSENDTLKFTFGKDNTTYTGNKKNNILNTLIKDNNMFSIQNPKNPHIYIDNEIKTYQNNINIIRNSKSNYDDMQYNALVDYLTIYFYYRIFNINFENIKDQNTLKKLDFYYNEVLDNLKLMDRINTVTNKKLISGLLYYTSFKKQNPKLLENLQFLDKRILETEALNGYLLDYLEYDPNITPEEKSIIKKYVHNTEDIPVEKLGKIPDEVLTSKVQKFDSGDELLLNSFSVKTEKLILIDLWATWCIPCLHEMPAWQKAQEKYKGKIKFIRISIDKDKEKWSKFLKKKNNKDFNYIITNPDHPFIKKFQINLIPRFILLNKNLEIISDDFIRPSDANFTSQIEKNLN